jgi:hypothetical protein
MAKSLFYRLFGFGKVPAPLMAELNGEGMVVFDEGIKGSVTYCDFAAPGKRFLWKRQGFAGSIALTKLRLVAVAFGNFLINVPLTDERLHQMNYSAEGNGAFCVEFDASLFHADWSGTVEYRFKTEEAKRLVEVLRPSVLRAASPQP